MRRRVEESGKGGWEVRCARALRRVLAGSEGGDLKVREAWEWREGAGAGVGREIRGRGKSE